MMDMMDMILKEQKEKIEKLAEMQDVFEKIENHQKEMLTKVKELLKKNTDNNQEDRNKINPCKRCGVEVEVTDFSHWWECKCPKCGRWATAGDLKKAIEVWDEINNTPLSPVPCPYSCGGTLNVPLSPFAASRVECNKCGWRAGPFRTQQDAVAFMEKIGRWSNDQF